MNKQKRIEILTRLREQNPHPTTELNFSSPFAGDGASNLD